MWLAIRVIRLFSKDLSRLATAVADIRDLYRLDLASRGVIQTNPALKDELEVSYASMEPEREY